MQILLTIIVFWSLCSIAKLATWMIKEGPDGVRVNDGATLVNYLRENDIPGRAIAAYIGSVALLPCAQTSKNQKSVWMYAESINYLAFRPLEENEMSVEDGNLTIFYVRQEDAGVYQCKMGPKISGLIVLEVLNDEDKYTVVKPQTSRGPYSSPPTPVTSELIVFSSWSAWSQCSRCGLVGRRRRYGICHVGRGKMNVNKFNVRNDSTAKAMDVSLDDAVFQIFQVIPGGVPCRSNILPNDIMGLPGVASRKNEIMIGLCKIPCKSQIFELRSHSGRVIERANNSEGVYSLWQREPPQPPPVSREIIFAAKGSAVIVQCPGTTLRDMPVTWRVSHREVPPRELDRQSGGRVHLSARDHIVITAVHYSDSNVYSCWQDQNLAGVVKLKAFEDTRSMYGRRVALLALFCSLCAVFRLTEKLYYCQRRRAA